MWSNSGQTVVKQWSNSGLHIIEDCRWLVTASGFIILQAIVKNKPPASKKSHWRWFLHEGTACVVRIVHEV